MGYKHAILRRIAQLAPNYWTQRIRNPIFIIGTGRSGTTLLANLIGDHPQIANYSEANHIWDPTGHPTPRGMAPDWVDPYVYNDRWWQENQHRLPEISATFSIFQFILMKDYFLNKSPYNTFRIPHILQMFPDARFIHIVRHGLAVVNSRLNKQRTFVGGMPYTYDGYDIAFDFETTALCFARLWRLSVEEVAKQDEQYQLSERGLIHHLTYEDICANPQQTMDTIQAFIGLDQPIVIEKSINNRNDKWRTYFEPSLVERLVAEMEPAFSARGYSID